MRPLSGYQWAALKLLTNDLRRGGGTFTGEDLAVYKQTTIGSFARASRGYLQRVSANAYRVTPQAVEARELFESADIIRRSKSLNLSVYLKSQSPKKVVEMEKSKVG